MTVAVQDSLSALKEAVSAIDQVTPVSNPKSIHEVLQAAFLTKVKEEMCAFEQLEGEALYNALKTHLTSQWARVKGTALSYTAMPVSDLTLYFLNIAERLCDVHQAMEPKEKPLTPFELMMPGVKLESASGDFINWIATLDPTWKMDKKDEWDRLQRLYHYGAFSDERCLLTQEQEDRFYRIKHKEEQKIPLTADESAFLKEMGRKAKNMQDKGTHKSMDNERKSNETIQQLINTQKLKVLGKYLIPPVNGSSFFSQHILSDEADSIIPIAVLLKDPPTHPYGERLLSPGEINRSTSDFIVFFIVYFMIYSGAFLGY